MLHREAPDLARRCQLLVEIDGDPRPVASDGRWEWEGTRLALLRRMKPIHVVVGSPAILLVASLVACAEPAPRTPNAPLARAEASSVAKPETQAASTATPAASPTAAPESMKCEVVCEGARVVPHVADPSDSADEFTQRAVEHADRVLNAMHDDLLSCYTKRLTQNPKAHAFLTIDIVVGPAGEVQRVESLGGALLGDVAMNCVLDRIRRERFEPPHSGGTMHFQVPFTMRRVAPGEPI
jgi:hypothetical protein